MKLYHGTGEDELDGILKRGWAPRILRPAQIRTELQGTFFTRSIELAKRYTMSRDTPVVIECLLLNAAVLPVQSLERLDGMTYDHIPLGYNALEIPSTVLQSHTLNEELAALRREPEIIVFDPATHIRIIKIHRPDKAELRAIVKS